MTIKIGTRKSPLALAQAHEVSARLGGGHSIVGMVTSGDRFQGQPLAEIGGKGLFTKELEDALYDGTVDIAVHSLKDMPTVLPDGLIIACVLPREDVRDVLISPHVKHLRDLVEGATFGTSSLRRAAQILHWRPDIKIIPLRGNVGTRITKIEQGVADATMLARAGLNRLKIENAIAHDVPVTECLPAVAQGAIGIECREDNDKIRALLATVNCADTMAAITCERAFLRVLDGSCRTPIAGYARIEEGMIQFNGLIANPDGTHLRRTHISGSIGDAEALGREAGEKLRVL